MTSGVGVLDRARRVAPGCLAGSLLSVCPPAPPPSSLPELSLTRSREYPLQAHEIVRGGLTLGGGLIVFWTAEGIWVQGDSSPRREVTCGGISLKGIVGGGRRGAAVVVVDTSARAAFEIVPATATCRRLEAIPVPHLVAAAPTSGGLVLIQRQRSGLASLVFLGGGDAGRRPEVREMPLLAHDMAATDWFFLSSLGQGAILGNHRWPFPWVVLDAEAHVALGSHDRGVALSVDPSLAVGPDAGNPLWYALPPLDLSIGYLQVLADLRSDRRRLLLFNRSGNLVRSRELVAPIGLFDADPGSKRMVGMQITDQNQLVEFTWRWHATPERSERR